MATKQKDIANRLNLSRSLVAGVLNNRTGVWASEETRRRILNAAEEMDYRPNAAAQSLRTGKTSTVAFVYQTPANEGIRQQLSGIVERIAESLSEIDHRLLVSVQPNQKRMCSALTELATSRSCDAFVLWGHEEEVEEMGVFLERLQVPFVVKGHHEHHHPTWPQIEFHHEKMMALAVHALAEAGHARIAYLGSNGSYRYVQYIIDGYYNAMMRRFGRPPSKQLIAAIPTDDIRAAERQMEDWLKLPVDQQPTAVIIGTNNSAWWGIERALHHKDRKIGFNDNDLAVAGLGWGKDFLHRGRGLQFEDVTQNYLAYEMGSRILNSLLQGKSLDNPVVLLEPQLTIVGSQGLDQYYQSLMIDIGDFSDARSDAVERIEK